MAPSSNDFKSKFSVGFCGVETMQCSKLCNFGIDSDILKIENMQIGLEIN